MTGHRIKRIKTIAVGSSLLVAAVIVGCSMYQSLTRAQNGNRMNANPSVARGPSDIVMVSNGGARRWPPSGGTPTDYNIRTLTGCTTVNVNTGYRGRPTQLIYDVLTSRWYFLGSVTTDVSSPTTDVVGRVCLAVSSGPSFPTTTAGWTTAFIDVPQGPYCANNGCLHNAHLEYASLGGDATWLVVSGVRANLRSPSDPGVPVAQTSWVCDNTAWFWAVSKTEFMAGNTNPATFAFPSTVVTDCNTSPATRKQAAKMLTPVQDIVANNDRFRLVGIDDQANRIVRIDEVRNDNLTQVIFLRTVAGADFANAVSFTAQTSSNACPDDYDNQPPTSLTAVPCQLDTRSYLGNRPHFTNAVQRDGHIWYAATVGKDASSNKIQVIHTNIGSNYATERFTATDSTSGNGLFNPWVATDNQNNVAMSLQRVGPFLRLATLLTGRRPSDPAGTLRPLSLIPDSDGDVFSASCNLDANGTPISGNPTGCQPNPYFFGRQTSLVLAPNGTSFSVAYARSRGSTSWPAREWDTQVLNFEQNELPQ